MPQQGNVGVDLQEPITIAATAATETIVPGGCRLAGWCLIESTGAAPAVAFLTSGKNVIAAISLAANGMSVHNVGLPGIHVAGDLALQMQSGSVEGAVYVSYMTD